MQFLRRNLIWVIIIAAAIFWSWNAWSQDILGDEVGYSFRSIGYLDYLSTSFQTTPVEWYNNLRLPDWTKLSFHDHPPLFFLIQHILFSFFGMSVFVARMPAMLFGIFSVFIFYKLVRRFASEYFALTAAFLLAFNSGMVSLFRSALIEPVLVGLVLFSLYSFILFLDNPRRFWVFGLSLGLVALTKYIGVFLLPVYLIYATIVQRRIFRDYRFYLAIVLAVIIFSPVIMYNFYLYRERGHLDLQFSYLLGQKTSEWTAQIGKSQNPFYLLPQNLVVFYGPAGLGMMALGLLAAIYQMFRRRLDEQMGRGFLLIFLYAVFFTIIVVFIGSAHRFLGLYAPAFFVLAAMIIYPSIFYFRPVWLFRTLAGLLILSELWYATRTNFINAHDFGLERLGRYFEQEFEGRVSGVIPQTENTHLNDVVQASAKKRSKLPPHLSLIVYNGNVDITTVLWVFTKKFFYESIPTLYVENYRKVLAAEGPGAFKGFTVYFVQSAPATLINPFKSGDKAGDIFETELVKKGLEPVEFIVNRRGIEMFRIYKFLLNN